jgi:hypothetical protein
MGYTIDLENQSLIEDDPGDESNEDRMVVARIEDVVTRKNLNKIDEKKDG